MSRAAGSDGYAYIADLYDEVGPYRDRPDVAFYVEAAVNAGGPVLITTADQLACLENIRAHLIDGGRLVLDVFNPSLEALVNRREGEEFGDEPEFTMPGGRRVVRTHKIVAHDRINQVNHIELIYYITHPDGREERVVDAFTMRYFFRYEMEHLLARSGFEVEQVFGGFDRSPPGSQYPGELIFVARKTP